MHSPCKFYLLVFSPVVCYLLILMLVIYFQPGSHHQITPLESKVNQIPLGAKLREVKKLMGSRHDFESEWTGNLIGKEFVQVHPRMITKMGTPQKYSIRIWQQGGFRVGVAFGKKGKVVGHWVKSKSGQPRHHTFGPYSVFKHLRLMFLKYFI